MKIKLFLKDVNIRKRALLIFMVQMITAITLMSIGSNQIINTYKGIRDVSKIIELDAFVLNDLTSYGKINELYSNPEVANFYKYIAKEIPERYCMYSYLPEKGEDNVIYERRVSNEKYLKLFPLSIKEGRTLLSADFDWDGQSAVPIIVGYDLQNNYEINKTYEIYSGDSFFEVIVVGILEKDFSLPSLYVLGKTESLSNSYIIPMSDTFMDYYAGFSDFHMALNFTIYIPDDISVLDEIIKKSSESNLFTLEFNSVDEIINQYVQDILFNAQATLFISGIMLIFSIVGLFAHLDRLIAKNKRNFAIHLLCGASPIQITLRLFIELVIVTLIACIPAILYLKFSIVLLYIIIAMLTIIFCAMLSLYFKISSSKFIFDFRRNRS